MLLSSKVKSLTIAAALVGVFSGAAHAQYAGPSSGAMAQSVKAILDNPVDDQAVRLEGHILRMIGNEKYTFSDGTGEITAEIDDTDMPKEKIDEKTRVEIVGEVDTGRNRAPEIDVDTVRIVR